MEIVRKPAGIYAANCYIVWDDKTKDCAVIDPGGDSDEIAQFIKDRGLSLKGILLTHGHVDHIAGVPELMKLCPSDVYIHEADEELLGDSEKNLSSMMITGPMTVDKAVVFDDGEVLNLGSLSFKVLHTPGHTAGSVCYLSGEDCFTGDTLFRGSIGRSDLYGGNGRDMNNSLFGVIKKLDDSIRVWPGHGPESTIGLEKRTNPYLR